MKTPDNNTPGSNKNSDRKVINFRDVKIKQKEAVIATNRKLEEAEFFYDRALGCEEVEEIDNAIADYKKAIELNPKYAIAMVNLGTLYFNQKEKTAAEYYFRLATKIDSKNIRAWHNLGSLYKGSKAARCYKRVLELNPEDHDARYNLAVSQEESKNYMAALTNYQKYIDSVKGASLDFKYIREAELAIERLKNKFK